MTHTEQRFKIVEEKIGNILSYRLQDNHTGEYVSILPEYGGAINGMAFSYEGELVEIMDGYSSEEEIKETLHSSYKGSNLFPFPNRIKDGKYRFLDQEHQLNMNYPQENNAIHGLVFDTEFKVVDAEDGEIACTLILEYNAEDPRPGYPFTYIIKLIYRLNEQGGFECVFKVSNSTDQSIPVAQGWHPYFMAGSEKIDELSLQFPAEEVLEVDKQRIPTGKTTNYKQFNKLTQIHDTQLDNCFKLLPENGCASILLKREDGFGYKIWQETGKYKYNYLQIYTPPGRKSIAIEPMTCAPDAFNNKQGLIVLAPFERFQTSWGISHL